MSSLEEAPQESQFVGVPYEFADSFDPETIETNGVTSYITNDHREKFFPQRHAAVVIEVGKRFEDTEFTEQLMQTLTLGNELDNELKINDLENKLGYMEPFDLEVAELLQTLHDLESSGRLTSQEASSRDAQLGVSVLLSSYLMHRYKRAQGILGSDLHISPELRQSMELNNDSLRQYTLGLLEQGFGGEISDYFGEHTQGVNLGLVFRREGEFYVSGVEADKDQTAYSYHSTRMDLSNTRESLINYAKGNPPSVRLHITRTSRDAEKTEGTSFTIFAESSGTSKENPEVSSINFRYSRQGLKRRDYYISDYVKPSGHKIVTGITVPTELGYQMVFDDEELPNGVRLFDVGPQPKDGTVHIDLLPMLRSYNDPVDKFVRRALEQMDQQVEEDLGVSVKDLFNQSNSNPREFILKTLKRQPTPTQKGESKEFKDRAQEVFPV